MTAPTFATVAAPAPDPAQPAPEGARRTGEQETERRRDPGRRRALRDMRRGVRSALARAFAVRHETAGADPLRPATPDGRVLVARELADAVDELRTGRVPGRRVGPPSSGDAVPDEMRARFERRTGASVAAVRVHTGPWSQHLAAELQARAFTVDRDIHFGAGEFRPGTPEGEQLLAHELTHTLQPRSGGPTPPRAFTHGEQDERAEREADAVAAAVLSRSQAVPAISSPRAPVAMQPKKKAKAKPPPKPKPIPFSLFATRFDATVDAAGVVTVKPVARAGGWTFTAAGANAVAAARTDDNLEYVHASGTTDPLVERTTISVPAAGPATVAPIEAVLGNPPTLTIALLGPKRAANRKSVVVNTATIEQLDLPAAAISFTPADGDAIHLGRGGDAWVFTTLKQDPTPPATARTPVRGFFLVGYFTRYNDRGTPTFGTATPSVAEAKRQSAIEDLADATKTTAARRITTEESDAFKTVAVIESDFSGVQTYDSGILSFGFAQWTANADLPRLLMKVSAPVFERYLGRYGLAVGAPVRQLDAFVARFVPSGRQSLGVRNVAEGALSLNGKELVTQALLDRATSRAPTLDALATQAATIQADVAAAKPNLTSTNAAAKAAAVKAIAAAKTKLTPLAAALKGLPGMKTDPDPGTHAGILQKVATDARDAAREIIANCASSQVMRGPEWALRFQMLGQDAGGQDAELAQARETFNKVKGMTTHGATFERLLPNDRGKAALLSSYFNNPAGTRRGMGRAVDQFKVTKKAEAKAAADAAVKAKKPVPSPTEADWDAFPWKATDARWGTFWPPVTDDFEAIAIVEVTAGNTDPTRRRDIIARLFP